MSPLKDNSIFSWTYELVADTLGGPEWLAYGLGALAVIMVVVNGFLLIGTIFTWMERKVVGRFQSRVGPNRRGWLGSVRSRRWSHRRCRRAACVPSTIEPGHCCTWTDERRQ